MEESNDKKLSLLNINEITSNTKKVMEILKKYLLKNNEYLIKNVRKKSKNTTIIYTNQNTYVLKQVLKNVLTSLKDLKDSNNNLFPKIVFYEENIYEDGMDVILFEYIKGRNVLNLDVYKKLLDKLIVFNRLKKMKYDKKEFHHYIINNSFFIPDFFDINKHNIEAINILNNNDIKFTNKQNVINFLKNNKPNEINDVLMYLSHNDLHHKNIIYNKKKNDVYMIDFDDVHMNFIGSDLIKMLWSPFDLSKKEELVAYYCNKLTIQELNYMYYYFYELYLYFIRKRNSYQYLFYTLPIIKKTLDTKIQNEKIKVL